MIGLLNSAAIEGSFFISQAVWFYRTRKFRRRAKEAGLSWEEFPEAIEWEEDRWRWGFGRKSRSSSPKISIEQEFGNIEVKNIQGESIETA